jgi:hypothetical protein
MHRLNRLQIYQNQLNTHADLSSIKHLIFTKKKVKFIHVSTTLGNSGIIFESLTSVQLPSKKSALFDSLVCSSHKALRLLNEFSVRTKMKILDQN